MIALVRLCCCISKDENHSIVMQVTFVWLVICSCSSSSTRIDDTLGRSFELCIDVYVDAGHVFTSCSYLCHKAYQPMF